MPGITIDLTGVRKKMSKSNFDRAQFIMANQMLMDMNENFVPQQEGHLRDTGHISANGEQLIWDAVYSRKHFYAPGGWNYTTPGTGPRWDLKAKGIFMSDWVKTFSKGAGF